MKRAAVVGIVAGAALLLVACAGGPQGPGATSPPPSDPTDAGSLSEEIASPTAATPASPSPASRPGSWSGIRVVDGQVEVVTDQQEVLHAEAITDGTQAYLTYTDVDHGVPVLWSTCCEPVPGTTAGQGFSEFGAQIDRVGEAMVRVGGDGTVFVHHQGSEEVVGFAGVLDATVVGDLAVALRDYGQVPDPAGEQSAGLALVHVGMDAEVAEVKALSERACALTRYGHDAVAVLQPDAGGSSGPDAPGPMYCRGSQLVVLDAGTGDVRETLALDGEIVHLSSDATGAWLIVTRDTGAVDWIGVDGSTGRLAEAGYIRADW